MSRCEKQWTLYDPKNNLMSYPLADSTLRDVGDCVVYTEWVQLLGDSNS